jgi:hypothetical protein
MRVLKEILSLLLLRFEGTKLLRPNDSKGLLAKRCIFRDQQNDLYFEN